MSFALVLKKTSWYRRRYSRPLRVTHNDRQALCELILLTNDNTERNVINFGPIAGPCQTKSNKPDGNCFFRSLAHVICGSEDKHLKFVVQLSNI